MGAPLLGVSPVVTIAGQSFDSPAIWHWLTRTLDSGGTVWITDQKPDGVLPSIGGDGDQPVYPHVWARQMDPRAESVGLETVWIWAHPAGRPWTMFAAPFSYIQGENNLIPLYASPTQKFGALKISNGVPEPIEPWSGSKGFWRDFAKATVAVGGLALGLTAITGAVSGVAGAGVTGVVPGATAVVPSEWAVATAGMGEGMGSAAAAAAATPTLAQIGSAAQTAVQTVQQAASSIVGVAAAVETVKQVTNPPQAHQTTPKPATDPQGFSPTLIGAGVLVLILLTSE